MRIFRAIITFLLTTAAFASNPQIPAQLTPAEQKIAWAKQVIGKKPDNYQAYSELAMALARRARETSDVQYYVQAERALRKSFSLKSENAEALKAEIWILLGKHEFAPAREKALALNKRMPDDVLVYGFLADANAELGNYDEAEKAAQWMLDIRPGNVPGLTRGAYLRELFGDLDGAVEFMNEAYDQTQPNELEDRAWILTQVAHLKLLVGDSDSAEKLLDQALKLFPGYHYALGCMAKVKIEQGRYDQAVDLLRRRAQAAPHAENLYDLAEALVRAGREIEAREVYDQFETKARGEMEIADNANRELIFYYADHANRPAEALRIGLTEASKRHDVYTLDACAWALYANGKYQEAHGKIVKALAVGVRDARLFYHAGMISLKSGDPASASRYLDQSINQDSHSEVAASARRALSDIRLASPLASR